MSKHAYDPDEDDKREVGNAQKRFAEFDCPECNANNPVDPPIGNKDEVICNYCGCDFQARVDDTGKLKLKPL